jgi:excinuclease ABC subunit B
VPSSDSPSEGRLINEDIDRLRLRATSSLMERDDVVIVSTVSAIYGLGDPIEYRERMVSLQKGQTIPRNDILRALVGIQYSRNDVAFERGTFRVRGDTVEILPAYEEQGVRVELWGDEIERISKINPLTGETIAVLDRAAIYPANTSSSRPTLEAAVGRDRPELSERLEVLRRDGSCSGAAARVAPLISDDDGIGTCAGIEG